MSLRNALEFLSVITDQFPPDHNHALLFMDGKLRLQMSCKESRIPLIFDDTDLDKELDIIVKEIRDLLESKPL